MAQQLAAAGDAEMAAALQFMHDRKPLPDLGGKPHSSSPATASGSTHQAGDDSGQTVTPPKRGRPVGSKTKRSHDGSTPGDKESPVVRDEVSMWVLVFYFQRLFPSHSCFHDMGCFRLMKAMAPSTEEMELKRKKLEIQQQELDVRRLEAENNKALLGALLTVLQSSVAARPPANQSV